MKRNIPTRIVETGRVVRGPAGQPTGWLQSMAERARNLFAQMTGIQERLRSPIAENGVPSCVSGELTFLADLNVTTTIAAFPTNPDAWAPVAFTTLTVNPIMLAGRTYKIPITNPPPGIFNAFNLVVGIDAGYTQFANVPISGITPMNDYRQYMPAASSQPGDGMVSVAAATARMQYTWQQQVLGEFATVLPFMPFLWNIIDEKSGRQYAQDWIPHGALLNTRGYGNGRNQVPGTATHPDGEFFEFDFPWEIERDGELTFLFRPIMDLYQVAAGDALMPYRAVNDLSGGRRTEQATVRVELHGDRVYTQQDIFKDGARV